MIVATYAPIFGVFSSIAIVFLVDALSRDSADPVKLVILTACSTGAVVFQNYYFLIGLQVFSMALWTYYSWKIFSRAPKYAKWHARLNFIGVIIFVAGSMWGSLSYAAVLLTSVSLLTTLQTYIPWYLIIGVAYIIIVLAFTRMPIIVNILPFTAIRIFVIDMIRGISLFTHDWVKLQDWMKREKPFDEDLFSSMLSGIGMILKESTKQGDVREIELDNAKLILKKSEQHEVAFVLIASKSTKSLRSSLQRFSDLFLERFSMHFGKAIDTSKYLPARELVKDCFPFAVDYTRES